MKKKQDGRNVKKIAISFNNILKIKIQNEI